MSVKYIRSVNKKSVKYKRSVYKKTFKYKSAVNNCRLNI